MENAIIHTLSRPYFPIPGNFFEKWGRDLRSDDMICNSTCCHLSNGDNFCSIDNNFTDFYNITPVSSLELAVRYMYAVPVTILGVVGNLIIISILWQNPLLLRASVNNFILNMSIADLILATSGPIPFTIRDTNTFWVLGPAWCHLEGYTQEMVLLVSVTSMTVISVDRMCGLGRPLHRHINIWGARLIIVCIWVYSAVMAVPFAIFRKYTVREWADLEETLCQETEQMNTWWKVNNGLLIWAPLFIIIFCYTVIFIKFRKYDRILGGPENAGLRNTRKKVVKMMFVVVLVFVVCWIPLQIFTICKKYFVDSDGSLESDKEDTYNLLLSIANYTLFLNPVADPAVYALMHENFRRAFRVTYPCFFKEKSNFILTRGTGNRGFMWSTRSHIGTSPPQTSRVSSQSQHSRKNGQVSTRGVDHEGTLTKKRTKKTWATWTHYGSRKYPHSTPQFSYKIPEIPSTITEVSKELSERSISYGGHETLTETRVPFPHIRVRARSWDATSNASENVKCDGVSLREVFLRDGRVTGSNGHIKTPNLTPTSLHIDQVVTVTPSYSYATASTASTGKEPVAKKLGNSKTES